MAMNNKSKGTIIFKNGTQEDIIYFNELRSDYIVFKTESDEYIYRKFDLNDQKFYRHRVVYDMYGNSDDEYTMVDIDKIIIYSEGRV